MIALRSNVHIVIADAEGRILRRQHARNLVVDTGLNELRDLLAGIGRRPTHIAVGTGTTATTAGTTALETEVYRQPLDRRIPTAKRLSTQILIGLSDANGYTLSEQGLFVSDTLIARALISPAIEKTSSIQATIVHDIILEAAS